MRGKGKDIVQMAEKRRRIMETAFRLYRSHRDFLHFSTASCAMRRARQFGSLRRCIFTVCRPVRLYPGRNRQECNGDRPRCHSQILDHQIRGRHRRQYEPGYLENCMVIDPTLSAAYSGAICGGISAGSSSITNYLFYAAGNVPAIGINNLGVPITGDCGYRLNLGEDITTGAARLSPTMGPTIIPRAQLSLPATVKSQQGMLSTMPRRMPAMAAQFVKSVRVYRDYELEIEFNASFEEFRELRVRE